VSRMTRKDSARHTAQQAAAQVKPVAAQAAAQVKPVAAQVAAQVKPVAAQVAAQVKPVAAQVAAQVKPVATQVAAQVKPVATQVAAQVKPIAQSAGAATQRGVYRTRAWTAPQIKRSGQTLEDTVAPKLSAVLAAAAQRIEPAKPRERHLRKIVGLSLLAAAAAVAAGAAAAAVRRRAKPDLGAPTPETEPGSTAAATEPPASHPATSTESDVNSQVRTP
jgi:hypothetical protein